LDHFLLEGGFLALGGAFGEQQAGLAPGDLPSFLGFLHVEFVRYLAIHEIVIAQLAVVDTIEIYPEVGFDLILKHLSMVAAALGTQLWPTPRDELPDGGC